MTIQQELKIYKKALFHYRLSLCIPLIKYFLGTYHGFCLYFIYHYNDIDLFDKCSQLLHQKPSLGGRINDMEEDKYWFPPGYLKPRINCLKQAIKNCEFIIKNNTNQNE
jgi:hypothetical protein